MNCEMVLQTFAKFHRDHRVNSYAQVDARGIETVRQLEEQGNIPDGTIIITFFDKAVITVSEAEEVGEEQFVAKSKGALNRSENSIFYGGKKCMVADLEDLDKEFEGDKFQGCAEWLDESDDLEAAVVWLGDYSFSSTVHYMTAEDKHVEPRGTQ